MKWKVFRIVMAALFFLEILGPANTLAQASPAAVTGIPITSVPTEFVKLAVQQFEDMRGSPMAPNWDNSADILSTVVPLYRPDLLPNIAYYEFIVKLGGSKPAGFIIVSTGSHDFPIPHWSSQGLSPTEQLDALALTQKISLVTYYRLDSLSYAGEDKGGVNMVNVGDKLVKISGLDAKATPQPDSLNNWAPGAASNESSPNPKSWIQAVAGPQTASYQFSAWASWNELKTGYAQSYGFLLNHLSQVAAQDWSVINNADLNGERLGKGDVRNIAVLCVSPTNLSVTGTGASFATTGLVTRAGLKPLFNITVNKDQFGVDHPLKVEYDCSNNMHLTYNYIIAPPTYYIMFPMVTKPAGAAVATILNQPAADPVGGEGSVNPAEGAASTPNTPSLVNDWGPWSYNWAFNAWTDAPLYNQMPAGASYNTNTCPSGCGATAWAMLFGWADYQARAANWWPYWKPRYGIYQVNGLWGTGDAVAPLIPDWTIDYITHEIELDIHTFCWGDSGATDPWNMGEAWHYLALRTGTRLVTHYNILGASDGALRDNVISSIRDRQTPAIIGTGWFGHYPLAMGYAQRSQSTRTCFIGICGGWNTEYQRYFWVDQGWGGNGNDWVSADTWFDGEIYP